MECRSVQASVVLVGPSRAGKSTVLGEMLYFWACVNQRERQRAEEAARSCQGDPQAWGSYLCMRTAKEQRSNRTIVPIWRLCQFVPAAMPTQMTIWDSPGTPGAVRNFHRALFAANESVLVVPADSPPSDWQQLLNVQIQACVAFGRPPIGAIITHMDSPEANFGETCRVVARILAENEIFTPFLSPWCPEFHPLYPAWFRAQVFHFLLACRFSRDLPRLPKDVQRMIIALMSPDEAESDFAFVEFSRGQKDFSSMLRIFGPATERQRKKLSGDEVAELSRRDPVVAIFESYSIKGIGLVQTGRVCQGILKVNDHSIITGVWDDPEEATVRSIERHHLMMEQARPQEFYGFNVRMAHHGLARNYTGSLTCWRGGVIGPARAVGGFSAQVKLYRSIKVGHTTMIYSGFARYLCQVEKIEGNNLLQFKVLSKGAFLATEGELSLIMGYDESSSHGRRTLLVGNVVYVTEG